MSEDGSETVFFAWQSDVTRSVTEKLKEALARAAATLGQKHKIEIIIDEAAREIAGSPELPAKIREKIAKADMFFADITTVTTDPKRGDNIPNPNVTFELGFAAAILGWDRIVLLYNRDVAPLEKLPFDFDRNRISSFSANPKGPTPRQGEKLDELMVLAIERILIDQPLKPRDKEGKTVEEIEHARDVATLTRVFGQISTGLIEHHTSAIPEHIFPSGPYMADILREATVRLSLKFYDKRIEKLLRNICRNLLSTLAHDEFYREMNNLGVQSISHINEPAFAARRAEAMKKQGNANARLKATLAEFTSLIHAEYPEIDLVQLSAAAQARFKKETGFSR